MSDEEGRDAATASKEMQTGSTPHEGTPTDGSQGGKTEEETAQNEPNDKEDRTEETKETAPRSVPRSDLNSGNPGSEAASGVSMDRERQQAEICVHDSRHADVSPPSLKRQSVSAETRHSMLSHHPSLEKHNGHRAFACYILGSSFVSDFSGRVIIPATYVAACYGCEKEHYQGRVRAVDLLRIFKRDVASGFEWDDSYGETKAREVKETGLDSEVVRAVEKDYHRPIEQLEKPVHFMDGHRISPTWKARQRSDEREQVEADSEEAPCAVAKRWRDYLHDLPVQAFADVKDRFSEAWDVVRSFDENKRREVARSLRAVETQVKPFYKFSPRTVRLTSDGQTLQSIDSEVRSVLLQDYEKFDLKSAQLAIVSEQWGCRDLHRFLDEGRDVWAYLCDQLDVPYTAPNKSVIKKGLYSTVYGANEFKVKFEYMKGEVKSLRQKGRDVDLDVQTLDRFSEVPLMAEVYEQRTKQMQRIQENGGANNIFGKWLSVKIRADMEDCDNPVPSILAAQNQAIEMWLLEPALDLAEEELTKKRPFFRIILNLHDGFAVKHYRCSQRNAEKLKRGVKKRAVDADIPTELEKED